MAGSSPIILTFRRDQSFSGMQLLVKMFKLTGNTLEVEESRLFVWLC